jgi:MFS transporter, DHA2 family, multidrug resistance protein
VAVLAVIFSIKQIASDSSEWLTVLTLLTGIIIGGIFIKRQRTLTDPFVDLGLFRKVSFNTSLAIYTLAGFVAFGSFFFIAQYLQLVMGLSPLQAGLWSLPSSLGFIAGSMITPMTIRWARPAYVIGGGFFLASIGFGMLIFTDTGGLTVLVAATVAYSLGISPAVILSTDLIVGSAPPQRSGAAASLSETSAEMGGAVGIAVLGSIGTAIYRSTMDKADLQGITVAVKEEAKETLGGAVAMAEELPAELKTSLLQSSMEAFEISFEINAIICALLSVIIGCVAIALLRENKTGNT